MRPHIMVLESNMGCINQHGPQQIKIQELKKTISFMKIIGNSGVS